MLSSTVIGKESIIAGKNASSKSRASRAPHVSRASLRSLLAHASSVVKSFTTLSDAERFVAGALPGAPSQAKPKKYYAVRLGKRPGIYTDWPLAQSQVVGFPHPVFKSFPTEKQAQEFLGCSSTSTLVSGPKVLQPPRPDCEAPPPVKKARICNGATLGASFREASGTEVTVDLPIEKGADVGGRQGLSLGRNLIVSTHLGRPFPRDADSKDQVESPGADHADEGDVRVYTDGSSLRNGQAEALAGIGVYFGPSDQRYASPCFSRCNSSFTRRNVSEALQGPRQTNQRAELTAVLKALEVVPECNVTIVTDSQYTINCVTKWCKRWRQNGWKAQNGRAVENQDVIQEILTRMEARDDAGLRTRFEWIKGHATCLGNIEADRLALDGARRVA